MRIFWDTHLFIYLWETGPFHQETRDFLKWIRSGPHQLLSSTFTLGELLVQPLRLGRQEKASAYKTYFSRLELASFTIREAHRFSELRAQCPGLKAPDAIQVASALSLKADVLITHDQRLFNLDLPLPLLALSKWRTLIPEASP